jgi:hypothetical protein
MAPARTGTVEPKRGVEWASSLAGGFLSAETRRSLGPTFAFPSHRGLYPSMRFPAKATPFSHTPKAFVLRFLVVRVARDPGPGISLTLFLFKGYTR